VKAREREFGNILTKEVLMELFDGLFQYFLKPAVLK
jgi:hypothetical protein